MIQIYAARTVGWKGALGVHTWIVLKRSGGTAGTRGYEVIGWASIAARRRSASIARARTTTGFGSRPDLLLDVRGDGVDALIDRVEAAVQAYLSTRRATALRPGPNSNTVHGVRRASRPGSCASICRRRPCGKDFLAGRRPGRSHAQRDWGPASLLRPRRRAGRMGGRGRG